MGAKAIKLCIGLRLLHHRIDQAHDGGRIAPGVVAAQQITPQGVGHKALRRLEHLRLGPAEAVNTLLGVTHQKHTGRLTRTGIAGQPRAQGLPLQGIGVLKFVNEQVAHAGIEPFLHPAAEHVIGHQRQRRAFQVSHVDPAAFALELCVLHHQQARESRHALLVQPSLVLGLGLRNFDQTVLRLANRLNACQLVAEFARSAFLGEQRVLGGSQVARRDSLLQSGCGFQAGLERGRTQQPCGVQQKPLHARTSQQFRRCGDSGKLGKLLGKVQHRCSYHALRIRQCKLHTLGQRGFQRLLGLVAAKGGHCFQIVLPRCRCRCHAHLKAGPYQGYRLSVVL